MKRDANETKVEKKKTKRLFLTLLDSVILLSFSLSVYFTLIQDYIRTILFMSIGTLFLIFFIVRGILKVHKKGYKF